MKLYSVKYLILINILLFLLFLLHASSRSLDRINPSQPLKDGDVMLSDGGTFALGFFTPSNISRKRYVGIWYNRSSKPTVVWVANRQNPLNDTSGVLSIDTFGNIVLVYNDTNLNLNSPIWSSNVLVPSSSHTFAKLQNTGNLVLIINEGRPKVLWQSFDYPGDTMVPFMKIGVNRKTGFNWSLTLGNVTHIIDPTGYAQMFICKNGAPFWRGGSWTGQRWSGIPQMTPNFIFNVTHVDDADEVSHVTQVMDPSVFLRMVLDNTGHETRTIWQANELANYERKHYGSLGKKGMVTLVVISICLITILVISSVCWFVKNNNQAKRIHKKELFDGENNSDLTLFDLKDIFEATNNFSDANMLGRGGFGSVYKAAVFGLLKNGMEIAVKRLSKNSGQGIEEFRNEVTLIAKLQHRNLVRILGCFMYGEEKMLIYEYLPNKSLDSFIFDQAKNLQLDWRKRFDIICGVARGLLYLHQDSDRPTMLEVVSMLDNDSTLPPPKQPAFLFKKTNCDYSNPSISGGVSSINEMSTTVVEAR